MAAATNLKQIKYDSKIKYDTNTLMQIKSSISVDNIIETYKKKAEDGSSEIEQKVEAMLEQYKQRKPENNAVNSGRFNPFLTTNTMPPVQPVPPEIQQQRVLSICKDREAYKMAKIETMEACLELLGSLSSDRLSPLAIVLKEGATLLIGAQDDKIKHAAEKLLQRMNISYVDHDNFDV